MNRKFLESLSAVLLLCTNCATAFTLPPHVWYASGSLGMEYPHFNANWRVNNGSGLTPPGNQDIYTFDNNHHPFINGSTGYYFTQNKAWFPALSLGLTYQYLPSNDIGGHIFQYSIPSFMNYNFRWDVTAHILLASAKLNLFQLHSFMPYLSAAAGPAYIRASSYHETALPDVTPRTSAGFAESTNTQFAYVLGAGLDYQLNTHYLLSLGYQYLSLGKIRSGSGAGSWYSETLYLGYYRSNEILLSLTYLIDANQITLA